MRGVLQRKISCQTISILFSDPIGDGTDQTATRFADDRRLLSVEEKTTGDQETNRLLDGFGQIRDGHVGDYVSSNGAGRDYELPASETDGRLVEVDHARSTACSGESGDMQLG